MAYPVRHPAPTAPAFPAVAAPDRHNGTATPPATCDPLTGSGARQPPPPENHIAARPGAPARQTRHPRTTRHSGPEPAPRFPTTRAGRGKSPGRGNIRQTPLPFREGPGVGPARKHHARAGSPAPPESERTLTSSRYGLAIVHRKDARSAPPFRRSRNPHPPRRPPPPQQPPGHAEPGDHHQPARRFGHGRHRLVDAQVVEAEIGPRQGIEAVPPSR